MRILKQQTLLFLFCLAFLGIQAQDEQKTSSINEGSIEDQFEFIVKNSNNWSDAKGQTYEVIKRQVLNSLKTNSIDSINTVKSKLEGAKGTVASQQKEINELRANLTKTQETLDNTSKEKDSMSLLGMQMSKTSYSILMWSLIAGLLTFLMLFVYKFKNSNVVTKAAKGKLADMASQFKEHKKKALEREQKVMRQLQDELNKQG